MNPANANTDRYAGLYGPDNPMGYSWPQGEDPDWATIPGWFDREGPFYGVTLYERMARKLLTGSRFVEVGVWMGRSTIAMLKTLERLDKTLDYTVVDTFRGSLGHSTRIAADGQDILDTFKQNLAQCGMLDRVRIQRGDSAETADQHRDESLDFCFIDGDHSYHGVQRDLAAWWPKIKPEGIFAGHDYNAKLEPSVVAAVDEFFGQRGVTVRNDNFCWVVHK